MSDKPRVRQNSDGTYTYDGLQNLVSNLGTRNDKRHHNEFVFPANFMDFTQFEAAYTDSWLARQIVDVPVEDALREWREFQCQEAQEIEDEETRLDVKGHYGEARKWARLYGGAVILMITDQDLMQPLDVERIQKGGLKRLVVLDRWEIQPQIINFSDPVAENYLMPEYYQVRGGTNRVHHSHIVRIDGEPMPRRIRAYNEGWGDSRLRQVLDDLGDVIATRSGIATMVQESNVDVVTREGLAAELSSDEETNIIKRFALSNQMKSIVNMLLLDGSEKFERKALAFSGLEGVFDKLMVWISGAADIPMTRLFGRSAAGMNATGEGDMNNYYDGLAGQQESKYRSELQRLDEVLIRSAVGTMPDECSWTWRPLYQESGVEKAQQGLANAQTDDIHKGHGLKNSHILQRLKAENRYAITDEEIEAVREEERQMEEGAFDIPESSGDDNNSDSRDGKQVKSSTIDEGFSESKVKRDPDGKFSKIGGKKESKGPNNSSEKIEVAGGKYKVPEEKEGHRRLYHGSQEKGINEIKEKGVFGGMFGSPSASAAVSHAGSEGSEENLYYLDVPEEKILTQGDDGDLDYDDQVAVINKISPVEISSDEQLEAFIDAVIYDENVYEMDEDVLKSVFIGDDMAEISWEAQRLRGLYAKEAGFQAVEMDDEHGTSVLVLPGAEINEAEKADD